MHNLEIQKIENEIKQLERNLNETSSGWRSRISKILKWPFVGLVGVGGGGAAASAVTVYSGSVLLSAELVVGTLSAPVLGGFFLGTALSSYFAAEGMNWLEQKLKERHVKTLKAKSIELIKKKIAILHKEEISAPIDFQFNITLSPDSVASASVSPNKMTEECCSDLGEVFALKKKTLVLKKIDISDAELTDEQFKDLVSAGMGYSGSETLILRNNKLSHEAIVYLHQKIVVDAESFQTLTTLDLSGNRLIAESLDLIYKIADKVGLRSLNLSNNNLGEKLPNQKTNQTDLDEFLGDKVNKLFDLQELELKNVGLSNDHEQSLMRLFGGVNNLQHLDLRENPCLSFIVINDALIKKGLKESLSLRDVKTDHDKKIIAKEHFDEMDKHLTQMGYDLKSTQSRVLFLIKALLQGVKMPASISKVLDRSIFFQKTIKSLLKKKPANDSTYNEMKMIETLKRKLQKPTTLAQQEEVPSPLILNQYAAPKENDKVKIKIRLLNDFKNGLMMFFGDSKVIIINTKTEKKALFHLKDLFEKLEEKEADTFIFPGEGVEGERILFVNYGNNKFVGFVKLMNQGEHIVQEEIDVDTLPEVIIEINPKTWTTKREELIYMPLENENPVEPQENPVEPQENPVEPQENPVKPAVKLAS